MKRVVRGAALLAAVVGLTACASGPYYRSDTYGYGPSRYYTYEESGTLRRVHAGTAVDVREVRFAGRRTSGGGALLGAIVGGLIGAQFGHGSGRAAAVLGGTVAGGMVGDRAEYRSGDRRGTEITVLLDSGDEVAVLQEDTAGIREGDRVRVVGWGASARVVRD